MKEELRAHRLHSQTSSITSSSNREPVETSAHSRLPLFSGRKEKNFCFLQERQDRVSYLRCKKDTSHCNIREITLCFSQMLTILSEGRTVTRESTCTDTDHRDLLQFVVPDARPRINNLLIRKAETLIRQALRAERERICKKKNPKIIILL